MSLSVAKIQNMEQAPAMAFQAKMPKKIAARGILPENHPANQNSTNWDNLMGCLGWLVLIGITIIGYISSCTDRSDTKTNQTEIAAPSSQDSTVPVLDIKE